MIAEAYAIRNPLLSGSDASIEAMTEPLGVPALRKMQGDFEKMQAAADSFGANPSPFASSLVLWLLAVSQSTENGTARSRRPFATKSGYFSMVCIASSYSTA
jgi:hypothetical protein